MVYAKPIAQVEPPSSDALERVMEVLNRRDLAAVRRRTALAKRLRVGETEILAISLLGVHGELPQIRLAELLDLSPGGTAALVQRLEGAGHVTRRVTHDDRRARLVHLTDATTLRLRALDAERTAAIGALIGRSGPAIVTFLEGLAACEERDGVRLAPPRDDATVVQVDFSPSRWG
jgi:DNA-binding MarR family transcriptional regulator